MSGNSTHKKLGTEIASQVGQKRAGSGINMSPLLSLVQICTYNTFLVMVSQVLVPSGTHFSSRVYY